MKILLLGKNGQVGWELNRTLLPLGEVVAVDYPEIDLIDLDSTRKLIYELKPQFVVNAAAYTDVDGAETQKAAAWKINALAPGMLAEVSADIHAALIHISTDYVFDGTAHRPLVESDEPNPINEYGRSKLAGEAAVIEKGVAYLIFRTSWVYSRRVGGFVNKVLRWSHEQNVMRVVADQISSPTWCRVLAEAISQVVAAGRDTAVSYCQEHRGLYHLAGSGIASRYEWAEKILEYDPDRENQIVKQVVPAQTDEFPTPAARPAYSALDCTLFQQTFGLCLPPWEQALRLALN